jgi:DNA-binding transcriptional LysR family regulator
MGQFDLNGALVLVRVVQAGSFRAAAERLGMPKTTVSRKVSELEAQLKVQLLQRTTRKLSLTDAGMAFVEEAEAAIARLEAAQEAVTELQREPRGRLRITTAVSIGELFLAPLLTQFLEAFPTVEVVLLLSDRLVDLVEERFDLAIRAGHLGDSSLIARRIGSACDRVVASPDYLARHGTPKRPSDLASHACLRFSRSGAEPRSNWSFGAGTRNSDVTVSGRLVSDDWVVLRTAAEQGLGIARLPGLLAHGALQSGRLVPLLEDQAPPPTPVQLVLPSGTRLPARTRAFIDFVQPRLTQALAGAGLA